MPDNKVILRLTRRALKVIESSSNRRIIPPKRMLREIKKGPREI